jgi:protein-S-isoprenylcysteine O-methyltransferase Ste14
MHNEQTMRRPVDPIGAALYALGFGVVLPVLLAVWSWKVSVALPAVFSPVWGGVLAVAGTLLAGFGMMSLARFGKGLPMNLYPPPRYVTAGAYRIAAHPIYAGFCLACAGFAIAFGSPGGLWLVSPVVMLGCTALVLGYESHDLRRNFGEPTARPWFRLPVGGPGAPLLHERFAVLCLVLLPWAVLYEAFVLMGVTPGSPSVLFSFEAGIPVVEWTEYLYAATYPLVTLAPFVAGSRQDLRDFAIRGLVATGFMVLFFVAIPVVSPPRFFHPESFAGSVLMLERGLDTPGNAFPSYHVVWILLAMEVYARRMARLCGAWWAVGAAVAVSTVTTGMHAIADVAAGLLVFVCVRNIRHVWEGIRLGAERIANSWREWRWGSVRVINHGMYAGIGSFLAVGIVGTLAGSSHTPATLLVALSAVIASALWAQIVEGSPSLLRPYGYYGGVLGIIVGAIGAMELFGTDAWLMLAGYSVAGPWVQSAGRLRCLVQGCCHGCRATEAVGIAYRHPRSRVTRLSELGGLPLHPTPVYSILWNVVIAVVLGRLWFLEVPLSMIGGLYLILTGLGRFVEEAYRGEPQTRTYGGLRFYQWIAAVTIAAGAVVTCFPAGPSGGPLAFDPTVVAAAAAFGLFTWFALGVDFPGSNSRFARLV